MIEAKWSIEQLPTTVFWPLMSSSLAMMDDQHAIEQLPAKGIATVLGSD
jgi:hypothetical protein